jgi:EmrB/QacA subfamily drug resistance transporter
MITGRHAEGHDSARNWVTLGVLLLATIIVIIDNTILTVAVPTLLRDFDTNLASLQWVISGYSLTFATLLIISGKLADLYGPRRMFVVGLAIFAVGSFLASIAQTTGQMIFGEAIVEGIGASLVLPASTGILTNTFRGPRRAMAYALWGTVVGAGAAFGPVIGGYLTTYHSWRWAFRINVVLAPIAAIVALLVMKRDRTVGRARFDLLGAAFVAVGSFALVFGVSQGPTYGWWEPLADLTVNGTAVWPTSRPLSIIPVMLGLSVVVLSTFFTYQRRRERGGREALFPLSQLRHRGFRNGLLTALVFTIGSVGFMFVVPVFLQQGKHFSAARAGAWLLPYGLAILIGAQIAGRFTQVIGPVRVVRAGTIVSVVGTLLLPFVISPSVSLLALAPAMFVAGFGAGFVNTQLSNVILVDVDAGHASVAGATASTVRQLGSALGIAAVGAALSTVSLQAALDEVRGAALSPAARAATEARLRADGLTAADAPDAPAALVRAIEEAVASGTRPALLLAAIALVVSVVTAYLIPTTVGLHGNRRVAGRDEADADDAGVASLLDILPADVP